MRKPYEIRYTGAFGRSLYGVYHDKDAAQAALLEAIARALQFKETKLAASFHIE